MSLFDDIAGQAFGGGSQNNVLNAVMGLLNNQQAGGLAGLVEQFAGNGLGDIVHSWVGTGQNLPVTPQQIQQGLGSDTINQLASQSGLSVDHLTSQLSQLLPGVVDRLTPNGQIPQGDIMSQGMELLRGFLK